MYYCLACMKEKFNDKCKLILFENRSLSSLHQTGQDLYLCVPIHLYLDKCVCKSNQNLINNKNQSYLHLSYKTQNLIYQLNNQLFFLWFLWNMGATLFNPIQYQKIPHQNTTNGHVPFLCLETCIYIYIYILHFKKKSVHL